MKKKYIGELIKKSPIVEKKKKYELCGKRKIYLLELKIEKKRVEWKKNGKEVQNVLLLYWRL